METVSSLDELSSHFSDKLQLMIHCLMLRDVHKDPDDVELLLNLNNNISDLKIVLFNMKQELAKQRQSVEQFKVLKELMLCNNSDLQHAEENLPGKLPKLITPDKPEVNRAMLDASSGQKVTEFNKPARNLKPKKGPHVHSMDYITVEEFDQVPKYMKGRMTYDQMNNAVDEINKAFLKKYDIIFTPKSELTEQIRKKIADFKKQESKDTKGFNFVTEENIAKLSSLKMDSVARAVLIILRHTGRLKLIRGGGFTRHALAYW